MYISQYADGFQCVRVAEETTNYVDAIIDFLKAHSDQSFTCSEIAEGCYNEARTLTHYYKLLTRLTPQAVGVVVNRCKKYLIRHEGTKFVPVIDNWVCTNPDSTGCKNYEPIYKNKVVKYYTWQWNGGN